MKIKRNKVIHFTNINLTETVMNAHQWILFILMSLIFQTASAQQNKKALIIAIGDYPKETDWAPISSVKDISLISNALAKQGFSNIDSIKNEQSTKAGIVKALEDLAKNAKAGDIIVVHISSHGQQIDDNNGDEMDGYDEAIVAYGAPMYSDDGYKGENHLRDEELGELLDNIRIKIGPTGDLMVFLDACHSGTGTRGSEKARGGAEPIHIAGANKQIRNGEDNNNLFESTSQSRGDNSPMSPMVVFSGARASERNFEYKGYGSLSTAIARSFNQLNAGMSYLVLWANIMKEMSVIAPDQHPEAEGDLKRELFGGKVVQAPKYYTILSAERNYITLFGGKINGLFKDAEIAVYPAGTLDFKNIKPEATGKINFSEYNFASANLSNELKGSLNNYWVLITKQTFGDIQMHANLNIESKKLKEEFLNVNGSFGLLAIEKNNTDFEISANNEGLMVKRNSDGVVIKEKIATNDSFQAFQNYVSTFLQGKFIKELELKDPSIQVELTIQPVIVMNKRIVDTPSINNYTKGGVMQFRDGDKITFKVTNKGTKDAYFTILDIDPNGKISAVVPNIKNNESPKDYFIKAGETKWLDRKAVTVREPLGKETIKVIASHDELNIGPIISTGGDTETRGTEKSLERLFRNSFKASTRGDVETLLPDTEANTTSLVIEIIK